MFPYHYKIREILEPFVFPPASWVARHWPPCPAGYAPSVVRACPSCLARDCPRKSPSSGSSSSERLVSQLQLRRSEIMSGKKLHRFIDFYVPYEKTNRSNSTAHPPYPTWLVVQRRASANPDKSGAPPSTPPAYPLPTQTASTPTPPRRYGRDSGERPSSPLSGTGRCLREA